MITGILSTAFGVLALRSPIRSSETAVRRAIAGRFVEWLGVGFLCVSGFKFMLERASHVMFNPHEELMYSSAQGTPDPRSADVLAMVPSPEPASTHAMETYFLVNQHLQNAATALFLLCCAISIVLWVVSAFASRRLRLPNLKSWMWAAAAATSYAVVAFLCEYAEFRLIASDLKVLHIRLW